MIWMRRGADGHANRGWQDVRDVRDADGHGGPSILGGDMQEMTLPYLTVDVPGMGGELKQHLEDFVVDEVPLYEASGEGSHTYIHVKKWGIPTLMAVKKLSRALGINARDVGVPGMKDAQGVTTQWLSVEHCDPSRVWAFKDNQMEILEVSRHKNKLRTGHLRGNRFQIRVRGAAPGALKTAGSILGVLERRGVPNYFGVQRFGNRGDTGDLGLMLLSGDMPGFLSLFLGQATSQDTEAMRGARDAFDAGHLERALGLWPHHCESERRILSVLIKGGDDTRVLRAIDRRLSKLYVSAGQSQLFNEILARRVHEIDHVREGDLAQKMDSGGIFLVDEPLVEDSRAQSFEISPTGPLIGERCRMAEGVPGDIERDVLTRNGFPADGFTPDRLLEAPGARRSLRFRIQEVDVGEGADEHGDYLQLAFFAPSGAYATVVMRELMKS